LSNRTALLKVKYVVIVIILYRSVDVLSSVSCPFVTITSTLYLRSLAISNSSVFLMCPEIGSFFWFSVGFSYRIITIPSSGQHVFCWHKRVVYMHSTYNLKWIVNWALQSINNHNNSTIY